MGEELKCQFCSLGFTSIYKIIPHIYFGHRKKVTKYVREHGEVVLYCPAKCDFKASRPVGKGSGPDLVFPALSQVLAELETHMVEKCDKVQESKLTVCPYCNISLDNLVYWEHLEEHMGATPNTTKTPPKPAQPTPPKPEPSLKTPEQSESSNKVDSNVPGKEASPSTSEQETKPGEPMNTTDEKMTSSDNIIVSNSEQKEDKLSSADDETKQVEQDILEKHNLEEEAKKKEKEEEARKEALAEEMRKKALEEQAKREALAEEERTRALEEEAKRKALEEEEEEARKQAAEEEKKKQARQEELRKQAIEEEIKKQAKQEEIRIKLKEIEKKIAEKKREDKKKAEEEAAAAAAAAHLKAEEECAEVDRLIREGEAAAAEAERKAKEAAEAERKSKEEKEMAERKVAEEKEIAEKRAREEKDKKLALKKSQEEKTLAIDVKEQSCENVEEKLNAAVEARMKEDTGTKSLLPVVTPEKPLAVKKKSGSESSSLKASPTSVTVSPREDKRSPGEPVGRSRKPEEVPRLEEKSRKLSGKAEQERKVEQEKVRRESGKKTSGGAWEVTGKVVAEKPKPVLTEEMEREIIFGSFMKDKKGEKKETKEETMPTISKKVEKKESREDKLQSVRKEIEARFREEEERRRREKQEKEERMRKEREKQRKHEEKLQKEREKLLKERRMERKRQRVDEELFAKEAPADVTEEEEEAMDTSEKENEADAEEVPKSPEFTNPYERIKEEILKMEKEKAEMDKKRKMEKEAEEREELDEEDDESRSPTRSRQSSQPPRTARPPPPVEETRTVRMVSSPQDADTTVTPRPLDDGEDDDMDDLEMMMRDFKEAESKEKVAPPVRAPPAAKVDSLALLRDSYGPKEPRSPSPKRSRAAIIPSGFDADGHPLPAAGGELPLLARAATSTALAIMGPAKREKGSSSSSSHQLECSLCKEEASTSPTSYTSAYQLLSHVFLAHRKKIVSRSRKQRGMTLACPEGCGFVTRQSAQGVSIDFFNAQLPLHLESLCDHIISDHTGEDKMTVCHFCDLPLNHREAWSWQHLANHRDARRQFCTTCKTFPFKTEVHKCPGPAEVPAKKTLEELAREVEAGVVDPEDLAPQKHLGNIAVWQCPVCPKSFPSLSLWLDHLISDHFGKNSDKLVFSLKCFCCTWKPLKAAQMDRGNEALAVEQLVGHLLAEHNHHLWSDPDCERELRRVARAAKEHQKLQEREKEEAAIVVPKLPAPSPTGVGECLTAEEWKYHTLALKYGEVFCAGCHKCFIGYKFRGHKARCRELPPGVDRVEVVQETKDTWVEVAGRRARVFFEYRAGECGTVARTVTRGKAITGSGSSHEEACDNLKKEVQDHLIYLKHELKVQSQEKENAGRKEELERQDRQALLDLFIELARRDEESRKKRFTVRVRGEELLVGTKLGFTKWGATKITATVVETNGTMHSGEGETRELAVADLERAVAHLQLQRIEKGGARFCCLTCGTRFKREQLFQLHQDSAVCQQ